MQRIPHRLRPNTATTRPESMIFVDTETRQVLVDDVFTRQDFRLGVAHYWRKRRDDKADQRVWLEFTDIPTFWDWTLSRARCNATLYVVAHNLAFDMMTLRMFVELPSRGWRLLFQHESQGTRLFKWGFPSEELLAWLDEGKDIRQFSGKHWTKTLLAMDNCNLFRGSIETLGEEVGYPKLEMPPYEASDDVWFPYCKRDVEVMVQLWEQWFVFLDEHKMGTFRTTIGSQAFNAFRHGYMQHTIEIHTNERAIALERESYYGGRTEAFWVGRMSGADLIMLDVNSMYAYVMKEHSYPTQLLRVGKGMSLDVLGKTIQQLGVIARVKLECDLPVYPVKQTEKNCYPTGSFTTTLTTPELAFALEHGWIVSVMEFATYRLRPIFVKYIDHFNAVKIEYERAGNRFGRAMAKNLQTNLYGKFGQLGYHDTIIGIADPLDIVVVHGYSKTLGCRVTIYTAGGIVIEQARYGEGYDSLAAIPAHVTAYARLYLWRLIQEAGRDHVFYCDTDSMIVDRVGFDALAAYINPDRLGCLKIEAVSDSMSIRAPKEYQFGAKSAKKGVPKNALETEPDTYEMEIWPSLLSLLGQGKRDSYYNRKITKELTYTVDWGELQPDGWVAPFHLGVSPLQF